MRLYSLRLTALGALLMEKVMAVSQKMGQSSCLRKLKRSKFMLEIGRDFDVLGRSLEASQ